MTTTSSDEASVAGSDFTGDQRATTVSGATREYVDRLRGGDMGALPAVLGLIVKVAQALGPPGSLLVRHLVPAPEEHVVEVHRPERVDRRSLLEPGPQLDAQGVRVQVQRVERCRLGRGQPGLGVVEIGRR